MVGQHDGSGGEMSAESGRRRVLKWLAGAGATAAALVVLVPGASFVLDPLLRRRKKAGDFLPVGDAAVLRADRPVSLPVIGEYVDAWTRAPRTELGTVWLQKNGDEVVAVSAECPHLGCRVGYDQENEQFTCPCHESAFGLDGAVKTGPSPRPLDQIEARIRDGQVEVRFRRFRTQVEEQVEIG
jgi:Rieske Fe-S protein